MGCEGGGGDGPGSCVWPEIGLRWHVRTRVHKSSNTNQSCLLVQLYSLHPTFRRGSTK